MIKGIFSNFIKISRVQKGNHFDNLNNEELYLMVLHFQKEKGRYLKEYFQIVERQCSLQNILGGEVQEYEEEKKISWQRYEACEQLVERCLAQTTRRISERVI